MNKEKIRRIGRVGGGGEEMRRSMEKAWKRGHTIEMGRKKE